MVAVKPRREVNLTEGPFLKKIAFFILPILFTGLLQSFYNSADLAIVGHFRGDLALAAVGSTGSITNLTVNFFMGLSVGAGVILANAIGAMDLVMARRTVHTATLLSFALGIVVMCIGIVGAPYFLKWMGTPDTVIEGATLYMTIFFMGLPASMLYNYCATMVRSSGDARHPLLFLSISGAVNVLLNLFFVSTCGMGVDGVALATVISQYLSAVMIVVFMYRSEGSVQLRFKELRIDPSIAKRILRIGVPSGLQSTLFAFSNVLIQSSVNSLGDAVVAGSAAASNIDTWVYIACNSGYQAAIVFIGQNMGARRYDNFKRIIAASILCSVVIGITVSSIVLLAPVTLLRVFISDNPEVIQAGLDRLYVILPVYFLCGIMEVFSGVLRGMGKSLQSMIVALITCCFFRVVWVNTVFYLSPSLKTIFVVYPITWGLALIVDVILVARYMRGLLKQKQEDTELVVNK